MSKCGAVRACVSVCVLRVYHKFVNIMLVRYGALAMFAFCFVPFFLLSRGSSNDQGPEKNNAAELTNKNVPFNTYI